MDEWFMSTGGLNLDTYFMTKVRVQSFEDQIGQ